MDETAQEGYALPTMRVETAPDGGTVSLSGHWNLRGLAQASPDLTVRLRHHAATAARWRLNDVSLLDTAGALVLWRTWGARLPPGVSMKPEHVAAFARWQQPGIPRIETTERPPVPWHARLRRVGSNMGDHALSFVTILGQFVLDLGHLLHSPREIPLREISATIHETGGRAMPITALVGFLIGVVVSYLSSFQLEAFGAQVYIVNILGLSIIRELGPLLAAILVAGRSGSAMTARIGVMRVTQELDALAAMGISQSLRLILPKVVALTIAMPLLVVWTDVIALAGGATSASLELGISFHQFVAKLPAAVPIENFWVGLGKGAVFGVFIALIACHFGLRIQPNTESIGNETTNSVVASITLVILVDAVFAIIFRGVGLP